MASREPEPFIGEKTTFAKKYPQIKLIRVEYEHTEDQISRDERAGVLTTSCIPPVLACKWKRCNEGGFEIDRQIIEPMVSERKTELEGSLSCSGHEMLGGKKKGYHCMNHLKFKATIEYCDPENK